MLVHSTIITRERVGPLDVEITSAGIYLRHSATGDVVHIPNRDLHMVGTLMVHQAANERIASAIARGQGDDDGYLPPRRRLSADGDVLLNREG